VSQGILILHPDDPGSGPQLRPLRQLLTDMGLIGAAVRGQQETFSAGEQFLQLITFMGCSPHIRLEPQGEHDNGYCFIRLKSFDAPRLRVSAHARPPRCQACAKPVAAAWLEQLETHGAVTCPHCGHRHRQPRQLRWRNDSGMARVFIEIHNIFPGEAQPVAALLRQLQELDGSPWRYFYLHTLK
jgi:uncharacterized Zn-finger protein